MDSGRRRPGQPAMADWAQSARSARLAVAKPLRRLAHTHAQIPDATAVKSAPPAIATASDSRGMAAPSSA